MNKKSKIIILILVILVILSVATHLFLTPNTVENSDAKNITDMLNRSVQIPASTDSVVATSPLLGGLDDHDGARVHGRGALQGRLHPLPDP